MEMTLNFLRNQNSRMILTGLVMPVGILALITMMVLPVPVFMLDVFFVGNILVSLLILMVAINTYRPLDFSSFPSLLLIATILRLGLNVASTRVVLNEGHTGTAAAGRVIEAFGQFVISGNYTVGIFVFIILVIINLVVITRGAGRVSEVSARFTLDAMPGKQMAIDADLNAGVLSNEEAKLRREEISSEADFYGAMDGASKFVKGDAVAGILILAINIIGGLIIGMAQHDLGIEEAASNYILLSIGDGLVAQIPSLLLAISTAIIVTRVSTTQDMAKHIGNQISLSRAWIPVAGVLMLIGFVPGMPNFLFLSAAVLAGAAGFLIFRREQNEPAQEAIAEAEAEAEALAEKKPDQIELDDVTDNSAVSVQLGYGLVEMVDDDAGGPLINRITSIRKQVSRALGFVVPPVRIRDDLTLDSNQYRIRMGHTIVGDDKVYPDRLLAIPGENSKIKLEGIDTKDPTFGMDAIWIKAPDKTKAESDNYVVVAPESVLATHLNKLLNKFAGDLIGQDDVQILLDNLANSSPNLVQSAVPKLVPLHHLTGILRELLSENVPISDLKRILEELANMSDRNLSITDTAEILRPALSGLLIQQVAPLNSTLPVITLDAELEQMLITTYRQQNESDLIIDTGLAQQILGEINAVNEKLSSEGRQPVIVVSPFIRRAFSKLVRQNIEDVHVLSFKELPDSRKIEVVASIGNANQETE